MFAIDLLSKGKLAALIDMHFRAEDLAPDAPLASGPLLAVRAFDAASRQGKYYDDFAVNSRDFMETSRGTETFCADCRRHLDILVDAARWRPDEEVTKAFEIIFDLLDHIDEGEDDVVLFADEGGSWQVGVDWEVIAPAYARCLNLTYDLGEGPEAFARPVLRLIEVHAAYCGEKILKSVRAVVAPDCAAALDDLAPAFGLKG